MDTYLFLVDLRFQSFELSDQGFELLFAVGCGLDAFLGAVENLGGLLECCIAVGSSISHYVGSELLKVSHVCVHSRQVGEQLLWLKVESFWVLDFEFEAFLGRKLVEAEIDCLCKLLTELFRDERFLAVSSDSSQQRYDHVRELE